MEYVVEGLGYLASVLVALSLTMSNVWRLRWINLAGAFAFVAYAGSIAAWPVLLVNAWIVGVDAFYIRQMARSRDSFEAFVRPSDDPILSSFIERYRDDIAGFFPQFNSTPNAATHSEKSREWLLVTRNLSPVGLVEYEWIESDTVLIHTDYVTPAYRDFKNGDRLYAKESGYFATQGAARIVANAHVEDHRRYLERIGFSPSSQQNGAFEKAVK